MAALGWAAALGAAGLCRFLLHVMGPMAVRGGGVVRNWRGDPVPVSMGVAAVLPVMATVAVAAAGGWFPAKAALALLFSAAVMTVAGLLDDVWGDGSVRGLRAHLVAAWRGRWTTGGMKAAAGAAAALVAGSLLAPASLWRALLAAGIVAASANGINLLDLRPGRAWKCLLAGWTGLAVAAWAGWGHGTSWPAAGNVAAGAGAGASLLLAGSQLGALVAYGPADLRGKVMMGDAGANGLGALLGAGTVLILPTPMHAVVLAAWIALHLYCDRFSLSETIARRPLLRWLDEWGRPPDPRS